MAARRRIGPRTDAMLLHLVEGVLVRRLPLLRIARINPSLERVDAHAALGVQLEVAKRERLAPRDVDRRSLVGAPKAGRIQPFSLGNRHCLIGIDANLGCIIADESLMLRSWRGICGGRCGWSWGSGWRHRRSRRIIGGWNARHRVGCLAVAARLYCLMNDATPPGCTCK